MMQIPALVTLGRLIVGGLRPFVDDIAVDLQRDVIALDDHFIQEPLIVLVVRVFNVNDVVQAAGLFPVGVGAVDLGFKAVVGPSFFLIGRVEIDAGVGVGEGHHLGLEMEILPVVIVNRPLVEDVGGAVVDDHLAVLDGPGVGLVADLPAVEGFAVKKVDKAILVGLAVAGLGSVGGADREKQCAGRNGDADAWE